MKLNETQSKIEYCAKRMDMELAKWTGPGAGARAGERDAERREAHFSVMGLGLGVLSVLGGRMG